MGIHSLSLQVMSAQDRHGLVIFDIDGTLTHTNAVDESCYEQAVGEVLGVTGISTDWGAYEHSTDNGILSQIIQTHCGRAPTGRDFRAVRARFIELIGERSRTDPNGWSEVGGAREVVQQLPSMGWQVAIATGGWGPSARCKLERAGIPLAGMPFACADHAFARVDIIRWAVRRANGTDHKSSNIPVVYVGDGVWDLEAARSGGYGFVGVGHGDRAARLAVAGSSEVLQDYRDRSRFEQALIGACPE